MKVIISLLLFFSLNIFPQTNNMWDFDEDPVAELTFVTTALANEFRDSEKHSYMLPAVSHYHELIRMSLRRSLDQRVEFNRLMIYSAAILGLCDALTGNHDLTYPTLSHLIELRHSLEELNKIFVQDLKRRSELWEQDLTEYNPAVSIHTLQDSIDRIRVGLPFMKALKFPAFDTSEFSLDQENNDPLIYYNR